MNELTQYITMLGIFYIFIGLYVFVIVWGDTESLVKGFATALIWPAIFCKKIFKGVVDFVKNIKGK